MNSVLEGKEQSRALNKWDFPGLQRGRIYSVNTSTEVPLWDVPSAPNLAPDLEFPYLPSQHLLSSKLSSYLQLPFGKTKSLCAKRDHNATTIPFLPTSAFSKSKLLSLDEGPETCPRLSLMARTPQIPQSIQWEQLWVQKGLLGQTASVISHLTWL